MPYKGIAFIFLVGSLDLFRFQLLVLLSGNQITVEVMELWTFLNTYPKFLWTGWINVIKVNEKNELTIILSDKNIVMLCDDL